MRLHETLAQFSDIVRSYEVIQYEVEGPHSRLKMRILLHVGDKDQVKASEATTLEEVLTVIRYETPQTS